jgi:cobalamin biosynthesis Mg chelatase CobN
MKKVWKILISLVLILIIGGAGTAYYFFKLKAYDVADEEVEEITETDYEIILPDEDGNSAIEEKIDEAKKQPESSNATVSSDTNEENSSSTNTAATRTAPADTSTAAGSSSSDKKTEDKSSSNHTSSSTNKEAGSKTGESNQDTVKEVTVANIKDKYYPSFDYLQIQANNKIDALISQAYGEFQTKRNNGETISFSYFYQKYTSASAALESNTDAAFHIIYSALQDDLKKNGFSPSHADSFKEEYEAAKEAREAAILNKVKEAL